MKTLMSITMAAAGFSNQLSAQLQLTPEGLFNQIRLIASSKATTTDRAAASDWRPMLSMEVQLDGTAGGNAFHSAGRLYIVVGQLPRMEDASLKSDVNPVEILLSDQRGIFCYSTHTYLLRRAGAMTDMMVDLSQVKLIDNGSSGTIEVTPIKQLTPFSAGRNTFFASTDSAGAAYQITEGSLRINLTQTGEVGGSIEMRGVNVGTTNTESITATFTGKPEAIGILDASTSNTIRSLPAAGSGGSGGLKF